MITNSGQLFLRALIIAAVSVPLTAATITVACTGPSVNVTESTPGSFGSIVCPQFDPSLGTLRSIDVGSPEGSPYLGTVTLMNTGSTPLIIYAGQPAITGARGLLHYQFPQGESIFAFVTAIPYDDLSLAPGESKPASVARSFRYSLGSVNQSLSPYIGGGNLTIPYLLNQISLLPPSALSPTRTPTAASLEIRPAVTLTYEYDVSTVVPEPSAIGLTCVGLGIGLALQNRRRRRQ